jgi:hypothetical protein
MPTIVVVSFSTGKKLLNKIDKLRGDLTRSKYINNSLERIVKESLDEKNKNTEMRIVDRNSFAATDQQGLLSKEKISD